MHRARPLLGTLVEISARDESARGASAIDQAFGAIERVHALMSFHEAKSDVTRLNDCAHRHSVAVHPWTWRVLAIAGRLYRRTQGLFDCTVAPELMRRGVLPARFTRAGAASFGHVVLESGSRVRYRRALALDLGGIAKGFAVDQAVRALRRRGIGAGVVNAGGDLRAFGAPARVQIRDPAAPGGAAITGEIDDAAIATSGAYFLPVRGASAIVDPRERGRLSFPQSVSVIAPTCTIADALTKVAAIARDADLARWRARAIFL